MTQRKWKTEDGWEVLTGWDRPLQHFFVNIERECRDCEGSGLSADATGGDHNRDCTICEGSGTEYLFNNLADSTGLTDQWGGMTIVSVAYVLTEKLTVRPEGLMDMLRYDQAHDMGNDIRDFGTLGKAKETAGQ